MAENLNYNASGSKCYGSNNKQTNCEKYGRLYNWKTAMKVCPSGWHLPSDSEWEELHKTVGEKVSGIKLKTKSGWHDYDGDYKRMSGNGTDEFGFSALPGGYVHLDGRFEHVGLRGYWWTATERDSSAYYWEIDRIFDNASRNCLSKSYMYSVRCVQNYQTIMNIDPNYPDAKKNWN